MSPRTPCSYSWKKGVSYLLVIVLLATQLLHISPAHGDPEKVQVHLVALLVEKSLTENPTRYEGLGLLGISSLMDRINRYATDIQNEQESTKVIIYTVEPTEDPYRIATALEKLYFDGDGTPEEITQLAGVVLVGNIPIPTVEKNQYRYPSIYPYTDFLHKQFIYALPAKVFVETDKAKDKQPEIWHGVIQPPVSGEEGNKLLATYFDKNHAYHQSIAGYDDFEKKVFFADLLHEPKKLDETRLKAYQAFIQHWEDIAYLRFTKHVAQVITNFVQEDTNKKLEENNVPTQENDTLFSSTPDIYTKTAIDTLLSRFLALFGDYPASIESWIDGSGRWEGKNADTFMNRISTKDEFSLRIIRKANDALEKKVDVIAQQLQKNVSIPVSRIASNYYYGLKAAAVTSADQCTIYKGSIQSETSAQMIEANRVYNPNNEPDECKEYGGCCGENIYYKNNKLSPAPKCNPFAATKSVYDMGGTLERDGGDTSYRVCLKETFPPTFPPQAVGGENTRVSKSISSIVYHKEPTGQTIAAQLKSKVAFSLPVDAPRYVDFLNQKDQYQRIDYINFFSLTKEKSISPEIIQQQIKNIITDKEKELGQQPSLLAALEQEVPTSLLADALYWRYLSIDEKYAYVFEHYLSNQKKNADGSYQDIYPPKTAGYESIFLSIPGQSNSLDLSLSPSFSPIADPTYDNLLSYLQLKEAEERTKNAAKELERQTIFQTNDQKIIDSYDTSCGSLDGVELLEWFGALECWMKKMLPPTISFIDDGESDLYDPTTEEVSHINTIQENIFPKTASASTIPVQTKRTDTPILTRISLSSNSTNANLVDKDAVMITISLFDQLGNSYTSQDGIPITLSAQQGKDAIAFETTELLATSGTMITYITPLKPGTALIQAKAGNLASNTLPLSIYETRTNLSLFTTDTEDNEHVNTEFPVGSTITAEATFEGIRNIPPSVSGTVQFTIQAKTKEGTATFLSPTTVPIANGKAITTLQVGNKQGIIKVIATPSDKKTPPQEEIITLIGDQASSIKLQPEFPSLPLGGTTKVAVTIHDKNNNRVSGNYPLDLFINENGKITDISDLDPIKEGVNTSISEESILICTIQKIGEGPINMRAHINSIPQDGSVSIASFQQKDITTSLSQESIEAGSTIPITITFTAPPTIEGDITLQTDPTLGIIQPSTVRLIRGKGQTLFYPSTKAGKAHITSTSAVSIAPVDLEILPGKAFKLVAESPKSFLQADGTDTTKVSVRVVDSYGNTVPSFSSVLNLSLTSATTGIATLTSTTPTLQQGIASTVLKTTTIPGDIHVVAKAATLLPAVLSIPSKKVANQQLLQHIPLNGLYTTILGTDAGNIQTPHYVGGSLLFNEGKAQVITTLITQPRIISTTTTAPLDIEEENKTIDIGEPFTSVEDAPETEAVGWHGTFKNQLLFAAGNSVGESTKWYASSLLINLGDPTIALKRNNPTGQFGYTKDMGRLLESYQGKTIYKLLPIDYNKDDMKDIFVVFADGQIDLLQNYGRGDTFKNMGTILRIQDGIASIDTSDMNNDGWEDLIISTEQQRIALLQNTGGAFERLPTTLDIPGKITDLVVKDMDMDGKNDLITTSDSGDITVFYGEEKGIATTGEKLDTIGISLSKDNLQSELVGYIKDIKMPTINAVPIPYSSSSETPSNEPKNFIPLNTIAGITSSKTVQNKTGNNKPLRINDTLRYNITITSDTTLQEFAIADTIPSLISLNPTSITCENCGPRYTIIKQASFNYPLLIGNITLEKGKPMTLSYEGTITSLPALSLTVGDFEMGKNKYPDIAIKYQDSTTLYLSSSPRMFTKTNPDTSLNIPEDTPKIIDRNNNGIPDEYEQDSDRDGTPDIVKKETDSWTLDSDKDGIPDAWDDYNDTKKDLLSMAEDSLNAIASKVQYGLCPKKSACLNLPINFAFLVPGPIMNPLTCQKVADAPKFPVFGIRPNIIPICTGPTCFPDSVFRLYISPTLTGKIATAMCFGPYNASLAWMGLPLGGNCILGPIKNMIPDSVCESVNSSLYQSTQAIFAASQAAHLGNDGISLMQVGYSMKKKSASSTSFDNGTYSLKAVENKNTRPPSFPDFIMEWVDKQVDEIVTKLTDLPTIYLILPDFKGTLGGPDISTSINLEKKKKVEIKFIGDILTTLNQLPFVNLHTETISIKYPYPPCIENGCTNLISYYELWANNLKKQIDTYVQQAKNDPSRIGKVQVAQKLIQRIRENVRTIQSYVQFPKYIKLFVHWKTTLLKQSITYIRSLTDVFGGYVNRNKAYIVKWIELTALLKNIVKTWQVIPKIFLDYRERCTTCRNDRGNSMCWELKLYSMLIPDLPVISLPKWPDIVLDLSHINGVVDIPIPTPQFIPQEIIIPKLPTIDIPSIQIDANIDAIIPRLPKLPNLPNLFPKLPKLPIPSLPDMPPPPKIPKIAGFVQPVVKVLDLALYIWCIIKKGPPVVAEPKLKATIEHLTERSGFLPMDFLKLQLPTPHIPGIKSINVTTFLQFRFNISALRTLVNNVAKQLNDITTNISRAPANVIKQEYQTITEPIPQNIPIDLQGWNTFQKNMKEISTLFSNNKDTLVTVDEMRQILLAQVSDVASVTNNTSVQALQKSLTETIASAPLIPTIPTPSRITAIEQTLLTALANAEKDEQHIAKMVQEKKNLASDKELQHLFASNNTIILASQYDNESSSASQSSYPIQPTLLAQNTTPDATESSLDVALQGLFLFDSQRKVSEPLMDYTEENNKNIQLTMADMDNDGDEDILYALQGDIYIKENSLKSRVEGTYFTTTPIHKNFKETFATLIPSINYIDTSAQSKQATISWLPDTSGQAIGYKLSLKKVINRFDLEKVRSFNEPIQTIFIAIPGQEASIQTIASLDNNSPMQTLTSPESPSITLSLPNGNYYGKIQAILQNNTLGTMNNITLLSPQTFGDTSIPTPAVEGGNIHEVSILQSLTLNATASSDPDTAITKYWWDLDPTKDSNNDGILTNDNDYSHSTDTKNPDMMNDPVLTMGPFTTAGEHRIYLHVMDENGNTSETEILISVFIPSITIDNASYTTHTITGKLKKPVAQEPFHIVRSRDGIINVLKTPSANTDGQYFSAQNGTYTITDLSTEPGLVVKDSQGKEIASIHEKTGNIILKDPFYTLQVVPATDTTHTKIVLQKQQTIILTLTVITDPNKEMSATTLHAIDTNTTDSIELVSVPANAPSFPNGIMIYDTASQTLLAAVATNGDIRRIDPSLSLQVKPVENKEAPLTIIISQNNKTLCEIIYPSSHTITIQ